MIYFDNSATTMQKPPEVAKAVADAIIRFGNPGRSFHGPVQLANSEIYKTRVEIAKLIGLDDPLSVAFTSSATESLNLVIGGLAQREDSVITTVAEHNSVLRPLYLTGCDLSFLGCDDKGCIEVDSFDNFIKPSTKYFVCTHGSNLTGNITKLKKLHKICKEKNITMILDISQTFGVIPVSIDMADIFCFTGHKGLFGPQGTGGIIVNGKYDFNITKTGGAGVNSFDMFQSKDMPDVFETGTQNGHGIYGLQKGVSFINETGTETIHKKEMRMLKSFYSGIKHLEGVTIYGDFPTDDRLPIISFNIAGLPSSELAERLWFDFGIATRAGSHCAPLLHKHFSTIDTGMVRLSFSYFNKDAEVQEGVVAVKKIAMQGDG